MNINSRVAKIRKTLKLTTRSFGEHINITGGAVTNIEKGVRNVTDRVISDICREFNVNEEWLRNNTGKMFIENSNSIIENLKSEFNLNDLDVILLTEYINLSIEQRQVLTTYFKNTFEKFNQLNNNFENEDCACEYEESSDNEKSIEERVAEAEREYLITVHGKTPEQLDTRDKILNFKPNSKSDKEHA